MESEVEQLHATWLQLLEVIEDLDYLQCIRELGTRDLQQLSRVLSQLRARLTAVQVGSEVVRQYVPSPASVSVHRSEGGQSRRREQNTREVRELPQQDRVASGERVEPPAPEQRSEAVGQQAQHVNEPPPQGRPVSGARPKVKIDSLKVPEFTGDRLKFSEFRRCFGALVEKQGYEEEVCLMYLRQALPRELDYLMVGVREMAVAWQRLEDRYAASKT